MNNKNEGDNNENVNLINRENKNDANFVREDINSNNISVKKENQNLSNSQKEVQESGNIPFRGNLGNNNMIRENNQYAASNNNPQIVNNEINSNENLLNKIGNPAYNQIPRNNENENDNRSNSIDEFKGVNPENVSNNARSVARSNLTLDPKNLPKRSLKKRKTMMASEQENIN